MYVLSDSFQNPLLVEHRVNNHPTGRPGEPGKRSPSVPAQSRQLGDPDIEVTKVVDPDLVKAMEVVHTPELDPFADKWHTGGRSGKTGW